ncbi:MAG: segregation and condensation protein A [Thiolinea sp.]
MSDEYFSKEKRVLMAMRKTLARIIRDLTPSDSAVRYPLSDETVQDIKMCFDLISARERELAEEAGRDNRDRPHFIDEPKTTNVISIQGLKSPKKDS